MIQKRVLHQQQGVKISVLGMILNLKNANNGKICGKIINIMVSLPPNKFNVDQIIRADNVYTDKMYIPNIG